MPYLVCILTSREEYNMAEYRLDSWDTEQPFATALTLWAVRECYRAIEQLGFDRECRAAERYEPERDKWAGHDPFPVLDEEEKTIEQLSLFKELAMGLRKIELLCDDDDFNTIQKEIAERQILSRNIDPDGPTIVPDGESNLAGAILADSIRSLNEYREAWESENPRQ